MSLESFEDMTVGRGNRSASSFTYLSVIALALVVGGLLRCSNLETLPLQVHNDEASSAVDGVARFMSGRGGWALAGSAFGGHPNLSYWLSAIPSRVAGEVTLWTLRFGAAIWGTMSLVVFAWFVGQAFGRRVALLSLLFVVPYHLHVHYSRTGFPYVHAILFMAFVSVAFTYFIQAPSIKRALVTGLTMGLAALVYPATHVLPFAIAAAVIFGVYPRLLRAEGSVQLATRNLLKLSLVFFAGIIIAMGPQVIYSARNGYSSRLIHTFVLHDHNIKHLGPQTGDAVVTPAGVVWFNFKRTLKFFYENDTAEQYQFNENPLPLWGSLLAAFGFLVLAWRSCRGDPISIYLTTTAVMTVVTSTMMVEGNFSPHLILFSLIIPISLALGVDVLLRTLRVKNAALVGLLALPLIVVWADWNWKFYHRIVSTERSRLTRGVTYLLNLPIERKSTKHLLNASELELYFGEPYYELIYANPKQTKLDKGAGVDQVVDALSHGESPSVIIEDESQAATLVDSLQSRGRTTTVYRYPNFPGVYVVVN